MSDHEQEPVTQEEIARAIDPNAFDKTVKKSTRSVVQWAVRRKWALDAADAILRDFTVTRKGEQRDETPEEALLRAIFEQPSEEENVTLDPKPYSNPFGSRIARQSWPSHWTSFDPGPGYSTDPADYSPKDR